MATLEKYSLSFLDSKIESFGKTFILESTLFTPSIVVIYLLFVLKFGPDYMKNRIPFKLNNLLIIYNIVQVAVSFFIVLRASLYSMKYGLVYINSNLHEEENFKEVRFLAFSYTTAKYIELLDTVFFVLRKKDKQITFLHVYHHVLMAVLLWLSTKYDMNENIIFLMLINSFVHIVMYGYYCLSAIPSIAKYLWWKKYITVMQLVQFVCVFIHMSLCYKYSKYPPSVGIMFTFFFNSSLFIFLFSDFYLKSYTKSSKVNKLEKGQ